MLRYAVVTFLEVEHVERCHDDALLLGGGLEGVRDPGMLASAVMAPRNAPGEVMSLAYIAAKYLTGISDAQAFVEGNKRTGLIAAGTFLLANDVDVKFGDIWEQHCVDYAERRLTFAQIEALIVAEMPYGDVWIDDELPSR